MKLILLINLFFGIYYLFNNKIFINNLFFSNKIRKESDIYIIKKNYKRKIK